MQRDVVALDQCLRSALLHIYELMDNIASLRWCYIWMFEILYIAYTQTEIHLDICKAVGQEKYKCIKTVYRANIGFPYSSQIVLERTKLIKKVALIYFF